MNPGRSPDTVSIVAPLGLLFRDRMDGRTVGAGLAVTACLPGTPWRKARSVVNPSGIHVFADLPGFGAGRFGAGDDAYWASAPEGKVILEMEDPERRFLPFTLSLAGFQRGVQEIRLFSGPARGFPTTMAVIRGELRTTAAGAAGGDVPAAWTWVKLRMTGFNGVFAEGLADREGRFAIAFPFPEPDRGSWEVTAEFLCSRLPAASIPDLARIFAQRPAAIRAGNASRPSFAATLIDRRELILRLPGPPWKPLMLIPEEPAP